METEKAPRGFSDDDFIDFLSRAQGMTLGQISAEVRAEAAKIRTNPLLGKSEAEIREVLDSHDCHASEEDGCATCGDAEDALCAACGACEGTGEIEGSDFVSGDSLAPGGFFEPNGVLSKCPECEGSGINQ